MKQLKTLSDYIYLHKVNLIEELSQH